MPDYEKCAECGMFVGEDEEHEACELCGDVMHPECVPENGIFQTCSTCAAAWGEGQ